MPTMALPMAAISNSVRGTSKKQVLHDVAELFATAYDLPERDVFDILLERERLGTTGLGRGVAIPHGRSRDVQGVVAVFARLQTPVSFDAPDDEPVDLVYALLAPADAGADHLKALHKISRLLKDEAMCQKLRGADNAEALYALLHDGNTVAAA